VTLRDSYRIGGIQLGAVVGAVVVSGVAVVSQAAAASDELPTGWFAAGWLVVVAVVLVPALRPATLIDGRGVTVRRVMRTSAHPWREISDIRFEQVTGPFARVTVRGAVLYDAELRRHELPYLTDRRLHGIEAAELATAELRKRWVASRGDSWQPRTAEVEALVENRQSRNRVWQHAMAAAAVGFLLALVVLFMVAQALPGQAARASLLLVVLPAVAFVGMAAVGLVRRRRDRSQ
jgi:FtsH-binding integral membrane protein